MILFAFYVIPTVAQHDVTRKELLQCCTKLVQSPASGVRFFDCAPFDYNNKLIRPYKSSFSLIDPQFLTRIYYASENQ